MSLNTIPSEELENHMTYMENRCTDDMKIHSMKLKPEPFESIRNGSKRYELRLYDDKRKGIRVGDRISFTETDTGETIDTVVTGLIVRDSFEELYEIIDHRLLGHAEGERGDPADMNRYYSPEQQAEHGVVAIGIGLSKG